MPTEHGNPPSAEEWTPGLEEMEWNRISRAGCYIFVDSGDLVRLPEEGFTATGLPSIAIISRNRRMLARISNNPVESLPVLRAIAAENGYLVNF